MDGWDYFTASDPTHGQVNFLGESAALSAGLVSSTSSSTIIKVDDTNHLGSGQSRNSIRITSKQTVKIGSLILADIKHIPYGNSLWPAFWTVGPNWPSGGEIDIVEQVNTATQNQMTLHTGAGCTLSQPMNATGNVLVDNCDVNATGNSGCGVQEKSTESWGAPFAANGGGVFATIFAEDGISIWFFPRHQIPDDIAGGQPNPEGWPLPSSRWEADSCDIGRFFADQSIVVDITLCGDWAGAVTSDCSAIVADPSNYRNAYFEFQYVKVYTI